MLPSFAHTYCRERWDNHLNPELTRAAWTDEEDLALIEAQVLFRYKIMSSNCSQRRLGNKWTKIARELRGRSENDVKNRWHSLAFRRKFPYLARKRKVEEADEPSPDLVVFDLRCDTSTR